MKSLENSQDFFVKTKTKTLLFVLEAPRDQDFGLEDYITGYNCVCLRIIWATISVPHQLFYVNPR